MSVQIPTRIAIAPAVLCGKPVIRGTRVAVELVIDLLGRDWTSQQIIEQYEHLQPQDITACLAYASQVLKAEHVYPIPA